MAKTAEEILQDKAGETATYIDEDGNKQMGTVIQNNIKDSLGTGYYGTAAEGYGQMLEETKKQNQAAADAATAETLAQIAQQTEKLNTDYGKSDKQIYRDYRTAVRDLPQQLAAMGITGGLSETSRVDLERGYGENLAASQLQRLAAIGELEAQGEAARRQNAAAAQQQNAAALQNYYAQLIQLSGQKYAEDQARQQQSAETLASMGDFSGYVALGLMTEEQAALMKKAWIYEHPNLAVRLGYVKQSSGGGGNRYYGSGDDGGDDGSGAGLTNTQRLYLEEAESRSATDPNWLERMLTTKSGQTERVSNDIKTVIKYINTGET